MQLRLLHALRCTPHALLVLLPVLPILTVSSLPANMSPARPQRALRGPAERMGGFSL